MQDNKVKNKEAQTMGIERIGNVQSSFGSSSTGGASGVGGRHASNREASSNDTQRQASNSEDVMIALELQGVQNLAYIKSMGKMDITTPEAAASYLGEEEVDNIEAMMAEFENGVDMYRDMIDDEFGDSLSEAERNALAAQVYANMQIQE